MSDPHMKLSHNKNNVCEVCDMSIVLVGQYLKGFLYGATI